MVSLNEDYKTTNDNMQDVYLHNECLKTPLLPLFYSFPAHFKPSTCLPLSLLFVFLCLFLFILDSIFSWMHQVLKFYYILAFSS